MIIPGRLCMGNIPYGKAEKKSSISSITEIMLNGVSLFVSLLTKEEEEKISIKEKKSVKKYIPIYHEKAIYTIGSVVAETKVKDTHVCVLRNNYMYLQMKIYLCMKLYM
jgi:sulfur relay (sulfurtransferase) DsrF/TusC family protein